MEHQARGGGFVHRDTALTRRRSPRKYRFTLYALDIPSIDDAGTPMTWRKLRFIIRTNILGQTSITGSRGHS